MRYLLLAVALCLALTPVDAAVRKPHPVKIQKPKRYKQSARRAKPMPQRRAQRRAN